MPEAVKLGKTNLEVNKNGFGALPIQRVPEEEAVNILISAYKNGINFFDTARFYTDSEEKIGKALSHVRDKVIIASKTMATTKENFRKDLETSLEMLKTDYIDIYQFHNPAYCPKPGDEAGLYEEMLKAKEKGQIKHIGLTNHRMHIAKEAIECGYYETLQFPFSYISGEEEKALVKSCKDKNIGFIAMKALGGGLINRADLAYAFMAEYENVVPIWGIQKLAELNEFLEYGRKNLSLTDEMCNEIEKDKVNLSGEFCRGCGYCMPCPAEIEINTCARMSLMLRRAPSEAWLTDEWKEKMKKIENCINCGQCKKRCPYNLDTPQLLKKNLEDYVNNFL